MTVGRTWSLWWDSSVVGWVQSLVCHQQGQSHLCSAAVRGKSTFYSGSCITTSTGIELPLQEQVFCTTGPHGHLQNCMTEHILKTINLSLRDKVWYL